MTERSDVQPQRSGGPPARRPFSPAGSDLRPEPTNVRGRFGERLGISYLEAHGYEILDVNVQTSVGEIDVIARDGDTVCFVEVKLRFTATAGTAIEAVERRKQRQLARCASAWLVTSGWRGACRFDVLGLDREADGGWRYTLIRDAFDAF